MYGNFDHPLPFVTKSRNTTFIISGFMNQTSGEIEEHTVSVSLKVLACKTAKLETTEVKVAPQIHY